MKVTFPTLLFLVFLTLKLVGYITWSWWWVTAPLWGGLAVVLVVTLFGALLIATAAILKAAFTWRGR